jgi:hypothetical protein
MSQCGVKKVRAQKVTFHVLPALSDSKIGKTRLYCLQTCVEVVNYEKQERNYYHKGLGGKKVWAVVASFFFFLVFFFFLQYWGLYSGLHALLNRCPTT